MRRFLMFLSACALAMVFVAPASAHPPGYRYPVGHPYSAGYARPYPGYPHTAGYDPWSRKAWSPAYGRPPYQHSHYRSYPHSLHRSQYTWCPVRRAYVPVNSFYLR